MLDDGEHVHAEGAGHDAEGEDHGAEPEGHDSDAEGHHAEGENNDATRAVAGKLAETAGAMAVIETPTEEQLWGTKEYTLKTCLVSGEELGGMGEPLVMLVGNQQVKLCCDDCVPGLKKDTAKLMAELSE